MLQGLIHQHLHLADAFIYFRVLRQSAQLARSQLYHPSLAVLASNLSFDNRNLLIRLRRLLLDLLEELRLCQPSGIPYLRSFD